MTGGTIDSEWDTAQDAVVVSEHSNIPAYFKKLNKTEEYMFTEICMKDSRALVEEDLQKVVETLEHSPSKRVLITHGLFTIPDTMQYIQKNLKRTDQVIMIIGSVSPLKGFAMSDAAFNIGYAIAKIEVSKPGVYTF